MTVKTYLRTYNTPTKDGVVWVQLYVKGERVHFSTKVSVDPKNWNDKTCRVKASDPNAKDKNLIVENVLARINDVLVKYRLKNRELTKDAFMRAYRRPADFPTFHVYVNEYMKKHDKTMRSGTFFSHRYVTNKIKEYAPNLTFDDITREWLDEYFLYLRNDLNNNANTAYKNMAIIKKYVRAALKDGYMDIDPFDGWKIKRGTPSCIYLTEDELTTLIQLYQSGELEAKYHNTLQFFLFLCFSSLHVGDAKRLKLEQFSSESFTYFRQKLETSKPEPIVVPISVPLNNLLKNIVGVRKKGLVFEDFPTDQCMNRYLKTIAQMAGIDKTLTHKVGRHTFATLFLRKTKDIAALREILGHSDISETLIYAHVLDESKIEGVQCFNAFIL